MANEEHLRILKSGVEKWNAWREENPDVEPDFTKADLRDLNFEGALLQKANFSEADIRGTDFMGAYLQDTNFSGIKAGSGKTAVFMSILVPLITGIIMIALIRLTAIFVLSSIYGGTLFISRILASEISMLIIAIVLMLSAVFFIESIRKKRYVSFISMYFFSIAITSATALIFAVFKSSAGALAFSIVLSMLMIGIVVLIFVSVLCSAVVTGKMGAMFAILVLLGSVIAYFASEFLDAPQIYVEAGADRQIIAHAAIGVFAITLEVLEIAELYLVRTEIMVTILIVFLSCYISWRTILEEKQFNMFRKIAISLGTYFGTNFQNATLSQADFSDAILHGVRFNNNSVFTLIKWKNAKKLHLANLYNTPLEAKEVRNLLVAPEHNMNVDFKGVNLESVYLTGAYLHNADLRNSDLNGTVLSHADITGAKLFATSRENWEIEGIKCEHVYWDEDGKERMPPDRDFEPGEFEKLYKQLPTFEYFFEQGFTPVGAFVMNDIVEHIKEKHPEFELTLDSFHSRGKPHAKFTVIHKDFVDQAASEIKSGFETQIKVLEGQRDQLMHVIAMLTGNPHAQLVGAVEGIVKQLIDKPRIQAKMIQGLNLVEHIDTLNQQGGDMGDDHININAGGDVAFAKDQAFAQINKTITESANLPETLETKLKDLSDAVQKMTQALPDAQAKDVTQDLQTLTEEATKDAPRKKWYELSGQGIIDAATAVGVAGKPVIDLTREVMKLLGG